MKKLKETVIVSAVRTPIGSYGGSLSSVTAPRLGAIVIKEAVNRAGIKPEQVDEVIMGNVLTAGEGQAPARQAAIYGGLPTSVACLTVNKVCGSGLKAVMLGTQSIMLGDSEIVVAGGMESMSQVPYYLPKARFGYRMGNGEIIDGMVHDGLWDPYNNFHMGNAGELCSKEYTIPREKQDEFSVRSYKLALKAQEEGWFKEEIVPVPVRQKKTEIEINEDEEPKRVIFDKIPNLRPAFAKDGVITAANASKINDGASALVLMSADKAKELGITPLAKVTAYTTASKDPEWFTTAPADAIQALLNKTGLKANDVDLYEINEAFAVVAMITNQLLGIEEDRVNVSGGAVALGHPIGASGARILTTLIYNLKRLQKRSGIASLCIGGGEAVAVLIEMMQ